MSSVDKVNKDISEFDLLTEKEKNGISNHVRKRIERILPFIQKPSASFSSVRNILLRELISNAIFLPIIQLLSDPDTINTLIEDHLIKQIKDQNLPEELTGVLNDSQSSYSTKSKSEDIENAAKKAADSLEHIFRLINNAEGQEQLQDLNDEVLEEIRKKRILILGQDRDSIVHGELVSDVMAYINQLYIYKKLIESRILEKKSRDKINLKKNEHSLNPLYTNKNTARGYENDLFLNSDNNNHYRSFSSQKRKSLDQYPQGKVASNQLPTFTLKELLNNVNGISAFAEFMDSLGLRLNLEFWINMNGLIKSRKISTIPITAIKSLWKAYFTLRVDELNANSELIGKVQKFLKKFRTPGTLELGYIPPEECWKAFQLMIEVQNDIYDNMNTYQYPEFLKTPLYIRFLHVFALSPQTGKIFAAINELSPTFKNQEEYEGLGIKCAETGPKILLDSNTFDYLDNPNTSFKDLENFEGKYSSNLGLDFKSSNELYSPIKSPTIHSAGNENFTDSESTNSLNHLQRVHLKPMDPVVKKPSTSKAELSSTKKNSALSVLKSISDISKMNHSPVISGMNSEFISDNTDTQDGIIPANNPIDISVLNTGDPFSCLSNNQQSDPPINFNILNNTSSIQCLDIKKSQNNIKILKESPKSSGFPESSNNVDKSRYQFYNLSDFESEIQDFVTANTTLHEYYSEKLAGNLYISNDLKIINNNLLLLSNKIKLLPSLISISQSKNNSADEKVFKNLLDYLMKNFSHLKDTKNIYQYYYLKNLINHKNTKIEVSKIFEFNAEEFDSNQDSSNLNQTLNNMISSASPEIDSRRADSNSLSNLKDIPIHKSSSKDSGKKKFWDSSLFSEMSNPSFKTISAKYNINILKLDPISDEFKLEWIVTKSYQQLFDFHKKLTFVYPESLKDLKFPMSRKSIFGFLKDPVEIQVSSFELYFNNLITKNDIINSDIFKRFISIPNDVISNNFDFTNRSDIINYDRSDFKLNLNIDNDADLEVDEVHLGLNGLTVYDSSIISNEINYYLDCLFKSKEALIDKDTFINNIYNHISSKIINCPRPGLTIPLVSTGTIYSELNSTKTPENPHIQNRSRSNLIEDIITKSDGEDLAIFTDTDKFESLIEDGSKKKTLAGFEIFKDVNSSFITKLNNMYPKFILGNIHI
ncbi:hypothetical protein AYI68_g2236 [Smittium mucronatum]|uniref:Uncharacterized protein n=1 Tax=Smittium mucronatum TaxID=133383 RepID=A0A1R0H3C2_9FUNG|nr:hypothetical protein AYI68_g2236 [Smittium mucronatum]